MYQMRQMRCKQQQQPQTNYFQWLFLCLRHLHFVDKTSDHSVVERCVAEPRWASVNRGVLICDECCSIHRGLGRHSSQVRHLTHTPWPPSQLQVMYMCMSYDTNLQSTHHVTHLSSRQLNNDHAKRHTAEYIKLWLLLLVYDL